MNDKIYENMEKHEAGLSCYACPDKDAKYLRDFNADIRTPFFRDIDKVIYSLAFIRYMEKTQVFSDKTDDHLQRRMLHVQYVSKIARTIGRALGLNEDLIEAAALGHDLGHTPFGHTGEKILDKISRELGEGYFMHNVNSVRQLLFIENGGKGHNISVQVLDAIMCHNGEMVSNEYHPLKKTSDDFIKEYYECYKNMDTAKYLRPMTLEGCVVRISDIIAYLGRDIEDGVRKGLITFEDVPKNITNVLGKSNSEIINTIILDIIKNSEGEDCIKLSEDVFNAINDLKKFNYENIYYKSMTDDDRNYLEVLFHKMAKKLLLDLETHNEDSPIYEDFIVNMSKDYLKDNSNERIVIDYISGMTDDYFYKVYKKLNIGE